MQTMSDQTYNGWTNRETWAVNLWLSNDEGMYRDMLTTVQLAKDYADGHPNVMAGIWTEEQAIRFNLADQIKQYVEELAPELEGAFSDLLNGALASVNWDEIAGALLDD